MTKHTEALKKTIMNDEVQLQNLKKEIELVLKQKEKNEIVNSKLQEQQEIMRVPEILDYVKLKATQHQLQKDVKNWQRKYEIAKMNERLSKSALIALRQKKSIN